MSHKICENCCVHAWNQSENIFVSISIINMKKSAEKILFPVFMSKIINSFPYAIAQAKSVSHDIWKYTPQHENSVQVSVSRAVPWKINWTPANEKLSIILLINARNNIFWQFFSYNYWNTYNENIFTLISGVYLAMGRGKLMSYDMEHRKWAHNNFHRSWVTDLLMPLGTGIEDVPDVLVTQMK